MKLTRPSPSMIVACTALVIAVGGTATAARTLIRSADIAPSAVATRHVANGAVTSAKLAAGAAGTAQIQDGAVTATKLAAGAVGAAQLQAGAVTAAQIAPGTIGSAQLQDGTLTSAKIAPGAIDQASQIADRTIALSALRSTAWGISTGWGVLPAGSCRPVTFTEGAGSPVVAGALILPGISPGLPTGVFVAPAVAPADGQPAFLLCNGTGGSIDLGAGFIQVNYRIVR